MTRKAKMHRDTGEEKGAGAATEIKTFDQLSDEEFDNVIKETPSEEEVVDDKKTTTPEEEKPDTPDEVIDDENIDDKKEKTETPDEEKPDETDLPEFTLTKTNEKGEDVETSWEDIAEATGITIVAEEGKEIGFEAYKAGVAKHIETQIAEVEKKSFDNYLDQFQPAAQLVIKALAANPDMDIADILNPLKEFDEVLSKDDEGLLRDKMEHSDGLKKDEIDEEIQRLKDEGRIGIEGKKIRNFVTGNRNTTAQNYLSEKSAAYDVAIQRKAEQRKREVEVMNKTIDDTSVFAGGKVTDEIKKDIKTKYAAGYYDKLLSTDSKKALKAILQIELGEQVEKRLLGKGKSEGVKSVTGTLLNKTVPTKTGASAKKAENKGEEEGSDTFDAWDAIHSQKVGVVRGNE